MANSETNKFIRQQVNKLYDKLIITLELKLWRIILLSSDRAKTSKLYSMFFHVKGETYKIDFGTNEITL